MPLDALADDLRGAGDFTRPVVLGEISSKDEPVVQRVVPVGGDFRVDDVQDDVDHSVTGVGEEDSAEVMLEPDELIPDTALSCGRRIL
jgi:hypothetical protein